MKNKKGFTLIELLAVIVILAIIMVIAVPQILKVIENSRNNAAKSSMDLLKSGIQTQIASAELTNNPFTKDGDGCYTFDFDSKNNNYEKLEVKNKERFSGQVKYCNGEITDTNLAFDGNTGSSTPIETKTYLYKSGNEYTSLTGGWSLENLQVNGRTERLSDSLRLYYATNGQSASIATTVNPIDLSDYSKIYIRYRLSNPYTYSEEIYRRLNYDIGDASHGLHGGIDNYAEGEYTGSIDISGVTGSHTILFSDCDVDIKIYEIWLEK